MLMSNSDKLALFYVSTLYSFKKNQQQTHKKTPRTKKKPQQPHPHNKTGDL